MTPAESAGEVGDGLTQLLTDIQALLEAGLLVEIRVPGEPSRYAVSEAESGLAGQPPAECSHHEFPLER